MKLCLMAALLGSSAGQGMSINSRAVAGSKVSHHLMNQTILEQT
jgi:hypothetical protein